jgi:threonine dehydrogenase-like Zn-dependent dehydrogenase
LAAGARRRRQRRGGGRRLRLDRRVRAAVISSPRTAELRHLPTPSPGPGEVLVELEGCGVCGSDLPVWQGRPWFDYPREPGAPGHEGWGRIVAAGAGVDAPAVGARVAAISFRSDAEFDVAPASAVVALPEELDGRPFPGEALGCAMNVARRCDLAEGQTVAVVGVGFLGALLVQLGARAGARVIAISRRPFALAVARAMGAEHVFGADDEDVVEAVRELTGGVLCDRVLEVTGAQAPLDLATQLARERGRLVIAGFHQDGPRSVDMQLWNWRGLDVVNAHERDPAVYVRGVRDAAQAIVRGGLDPARLYTHEFALGDIGAALDTAAARPDGFLKALVRP